MKHSQKKSSNKFEPTLYIFLSVDIIESTNIKYSDQGVKKWLPLFNDFYDNFPLIFNIKLQDNKKQELVKGYKCNYINIGLWKSLGDELLFSKELEHSKDMVHILFSFIETIEAYIKIYKDKRGEDIHLKGTAWLAGFPVMNTIIESQKKIDYIGPSIDLGFRLSKFANRHRFIISCDIAYILSLWTINEFDFYYLGEQKLRGVLKGELYPIFYLRSSTGPPKPKDNDLLQKLESSNVQTYCEEYINSSDFLILPFIEGDDTINKKPENYDKRLKEIIALL